MSHKSIEAGKQSQDPSDNTTKGSSPRAAGEEPAPKDPLIGKTIAGHYRIISTLGKGGMSSVYYAADIFLNRPAAIKLLPEHRTDDKSIARFHLEATAASRLDHPNIVKVYEYGIHNESQPFLAMEHVAGGSLSDLLKQERTLSLSRTIGMAKQICDALEHAHSKGIIHRDLKSSNIMVVTDRGNQDSIKLVDFGIAKIITDSAVHHLTTTGEVFGSPLYMSPEQCLGLQVDKRSDLYSLGCVLYECLTGIPPHVGDTPLATMVKHQQENALSLKEATLGGEFPPEIERMIAKMLSKQPQARYKSAAEVKFALLQFEKGESGAVGLEEPVPGADFQQDLNVSKLHNFQSLNPSTIASAAPDVLSKQARRRLALPGPASVVTVTAFVILLIISIGLANSHFKTRASVDTAQPSVPPRIAATSDGTKTGDALPTLTNNLVRLISFEESVNLMDKASSDPDRCELCCANWGLHPNNWTALKSMTHLRNLNLSESTFRPEDLGYLSDLPLMKLDLSSLAGSQSGHKILTGDNLSKIQGIKSLVWLSLEGLELTPDTLNFLNPNLRVLILSSGVYDDRCLLPLKRIKHLQWLELRHSKVSDQSIETLAQLRNLEYLDLLECANLSAKGKQALYNLLPRCVIDSEEAASGFNKSVRKRRNGLVRLPSGFDDVVRGAGFAK